MSIKTDNKTFEEWWNYCRSVNISDMDRKEIAEEAFETAFMSLEEITDKLANEIVAQNYYKEQNRVLIALANQASGMPIKNNL